MKKKLSELASSSSSEPSQQFDILSENLILTEIRHSRVLQIFSNNQRVKGAFTSRPMYAYEVEIPEDGTAPNKSVETDQQIKRILTSAKNANPSGANLKPVSENAPVPGHSRQSSYSSCGSMQTSYNESYNSGSFGDNLIVVVHRKIIRQETYFLAPMKASPVLFGMPLVVPHYEGMTHLDLYKRVWSLVARLVSPLPPAEGPNISNHAYDWYVYLEF